MKTIILWILKMFLGGIFKNVQNKEAEAARKERDGALAGVESIEEAKKTEDTIRSRVAEAEKTFKARQPDEKDPFNFGAWNRGEL